MSRSAAPALPVVSLNSRAFSIAIRAWSRKDSAWAISLGPNMLARFPASVSSPMHSSSRSSGRYSAELMPNVSWTTALVFGQLGERPVRQVQHRLRQVGARGKVGARIDREALGREPRHQSRRGRSRFWRIRVALTKGHQGHVAARAPARQSGRSCRTPAARRSATG